MSIRVDCRSPSFEKRVESPLTPTSGASLNLAECVPPKGPKSFILNEKVDKVVPKAPRAHLHSTTQVLIDGSEAPPIEPRTGSSDTDTTPKAPKALIIDTPAPKAPKAFGMDTDAPKAPKALLAVTSTRKQKVIERTYLEMQKHPFVHTPRMRVKEDENMNSVRTNVTVMAKCVLMAHLERTYH